MLGLQPAGLLQGTTARTFRFHMHACLPPDTPGVHAVVRRLPITTQRCVVAGEEAPAGIAQPRISPSERFHRWGCASTMRTPDCLRERLAARPDGSRAGRRCPAVR